jgi:hypothetical protein
VCATFLVKSGASRLLFPPPERGRIKVGVAGRLRDVAIAISPGRIILWDSERYRIPARIKLCTNCRWNSRNATSSGADVISVAAVMTDQSMP